MIKNVKTFTASALSSLISLSSLIYSAAIISLVACGSQHSVKLSPGNALPNVSTANSSLPDHPLNSVQKQMLLDRHQQAFVVLDHKIRDPFITLGPDNYFYLTGTTAGSHWGDTIGIQLWRSKNLADWEDLGFVWELYKDGKNANSWHFQQEIRNPQHKNPLAIWAPEIHFMNNTWWIPHSLNVSGHGLLRSVSGKPEGPYEALPKIANRGIDAHLFQDGGHTFYLWQADIIAKMNNNMTKLAEPAQKLPHQGHHPMGYEGVMILKVGNKYLHIASGRYGYEPTNTYDLYYSVSESLNEGYGKRRMAVKNAGHGNIFQDKQGRWWATAFDHEFINRKTMQRWNVWLVPLTIQESKGDIIITAKDPRFQPSQEDQDVVSALSINGPPKAWKGKAHWWRPETRKETSQNTIPQE